MSIKVAVLGAGLMGCGIARVFRRIGCEVVIFDPDPDALRAAVSDVRDDECPEAADDLLSAVRSADFVFEAATEVLEVKLDLLTRVQAVNECATFASNTSTFSPSLLAAAAARPEKVIVAHFFNPATVVPLVEIVEAAQTHPEVSRDLVDLLRRAGKRPVLIRKETPGFVANRLQAAVFREALHLVEHGIASYEQIDEVMTTSLGPRWSVAGPFQIADLGGLDIFAALADQLFPVLGRANQAPAMLEKLVAEGELGVKSGSGFYRYRGEEAAEELDRLRARIADACFSVPDRTDGDGRGSTIAREECLVAESMDTEGP